MRISQTYKDERVRVPSDVEGEFLYVAKSAYKGILSDQSIDVISVYPEGGKLVIKYETIRGNKTRFLILNDLGPKPDQEGDIKRWLTNSR